MSKQEQKARAAAAPAPPTPLFDRPGVGSFFTVLSGLAFLFLCMILPLVGKAGAATVHARENFVAFLVVLLACIALAALATVSKLHRRRIDKSPLPVFSLILLGVSTLLLIALLTGLLRI